jgi:hypothetical protein
MEALALFVTVYFAAVKYLRIRYYLGTELNKALVLNEM